MTEKLTDLPQWKALETHHAEFDRVNLRELFHVIELRSAKQGHASYRRIAQGMFRTATSVLPWLRELIRVDLNSYALARG